MLFHDSSLELHWICGNLTSFWDRNTVIVCAIFVWDCLNNKILFFIFKFQRSMQEFISFLSVFSSFQPFVSVFPCPFIVFDFVGTRKMSNIDKTDFDRSLFCKTLHVDIKRIMPIFSEQGLETSVTTALYDAFTVFNNPATPWFSLALCIWGTLFVEQWKRRRSASLSLL